MSTTTNRKPRTRKPRRAVYENAVEAAGGAVMHAIREWCPDGVNPTKFIADVVQNVQDYARDNDVDHVLLALAQPRPKTKHQIRGELIEQLSELAEQPGRGLLWFKRMADAGGGVSQMTVDHMRAVLADPDKFNEAA
jgi:hypothetical protein